MAKNIYVGNLSYEVSEDELRNIFEAYGAVETVSIITDKFTGRSKGFGFVTMANDGEAQKAIEALHQKDFKGRPITVNEARPRESGGGGGGYSGGGGGGRNSGGGGGGRERRW